MAVKAQPKTEMQEWYESGRDRTVPREPIPENDPRRRDWFALAMRFCRDGDDSLARYFKPVPADHVVEAGVRCVCGDVVEVEDRMFCECPSGCRWFMRDGEQVWAARLPADDS